MMYPYAEFLLAFDRKHHAYTHENRGTNTKAAVILESRPFFFLPMVLKNTMYFLGPDWNLHVLCGEMSETFIRQSVAGWNVRVLKVNNLYRTPVSVYNSILTSSQFWELFPEEKILIFQTDSLLCGHNIGEFLDYDFIGAPAVRFDEHFIANGGLSLRTRLRMLECLARQSAGTETEDIYFTRLMRELPAKMPDFQTACRFALESVYTTHPVGVHGTDKCYHSMQIAERVVRAIAF